MLLRALTVLIFSVCLARKISKEEALANGRVNVGIRSKAHDDVIIEQGDCMEGWVDGSSVGLGCVYADLTDMDIDEVTAETVCSQFGEAGRLVEILK